MFSTEIKIKNKNVKVVFGGKVMELLHEDGIGLKDLEKQMSENPFGFYPKAIFYGVVNGSKDWKGDGLTARDVHTWIDSVGGLFAEEVQEMIKLFGDSITKGIPVEAVEEASEEPKKRSRA